MAYNANIPQSTDQLSTSQGDILGNFIALGSIAGNANPASGSLNTTAGFNWIYLPSQGATPPAGAAFPAGQVGLYSFINTGSTRRELYINKTHQSGVVQVPATASILGTANPVPGVFGSTGYTFLPSGIKMVWGTQAGSLGGPVTVNLVGVQSFPTTILSIQLTVISPIVTAAQSLARVVDIGANTFRVVVSIPNATAFSNANFMYLVIGY